jgi:hypothetical protein
MRNSRLNFCLLVLCLVAGWRCAAQSIYFSSSSSVLSQNTLARVDPNGGSQVTLLTATGPSLNMLNRCTAVAVDALNERLFLIDGQSQAIWSANLDGTGLALVKKGLTGYPTDLALDVLSRQIYYTISSTLQNGNTVQRMDYTGANNVAVFSATGSSGNGVSRCTAIALDIASSMIFLADAGAQKIWSMSLAGSGLTALAVAANSFPTGLAVDTANQRVYFTLGSSQQSANQVMRVDYNGTGLSSVFTASGGVQRCTALDVDLAHSAIYLSDAGANTLWRLPIGGGSATSILSGLAATVKKVRWFGGPQTPPPPGLVGINLSGQNVVLTATNGFAGHPYRLLTSTDVARPLAFWLPVSTNTLTASGNFTITAPNAFQPSSPAQFYILQVQ